jgi:uncharacterized membrane protein YkvA (DUF1232 family)
MKIPVKSLYDFYRNAIRNPKYRVWIILGTLAYLLSPFDISPDFLPIAGQIDDFLLVSLLVTEVSQMVLDRYKSRKTNTTPDEASNETVEVNAISAE